MTGLTIGSLFSGYGGLDMAVEAALGATPAWFVEFDDAPSKILAHHWPNVPNYHDVTTVDWSTMPPVDILTGGYPCQPFSQAGQRKGTNDERHLWPYVREAIRHLRPRLVLLENVAGHRSLGFDQVLGDMASDGLHVRWTSLRASEIGAPHHRERLFILASFDGVCDPRHDAGRAEQRLEHAVAPPGVGEPGQDATDPAAVGEHPGGSPAEEAGPGDSHGSGDHRGERPAQVGREDATDTEGSRLSDQRQPRPSEEAVAGIGSRLGAFSDTDRNRCDGREGATHPGSEECARRAGLRAEGEEEVGRRRPGDSHNENVDWGPYAPAVRRWERLTRPAPAPTEPNTKGKPRLNAEFAEWMMGLPAGHITQVPGISRANQLKAIGNGVCPPQAIAAIHQLLTSPAPAGHFS